MSAPESILERLDRRRTPRGLGIAVAFLVGVLVTALVVPDRNEVVRTETSGGIDSSLGPDNAGEDRDAVGGPTAEGDGPGASPTGGGTVPAGPGGVGPTPSESGGGAPSTRAGTAPGVSADVIRVGFGIPDLGAIGALGPGYDQGDPVEHVEGILAQLREDGRLPVHGRDIEPVYDSYNIISADEQRATCEFFGNDVEVFALLAIHDFADGNECAAREYGIPTFTSDGLSDAVMARSAPNLFTMQMSGDRLLRNVARWADEAGFVTGKRIGVYYPDDPEISKVVRDSLISPLRQLGHDVVSEVTTSTTEAATGGPRDSVAVQRFRTDRVDVAILLVSAIAKTNFFNQAQLQAYEPLYLENDLAFSTTDTATGTYPADHFDQTPAFTGMRFGENNSGVPEPPEARWCRDAIAAQTGNQIPRKGRDAEYIASNQACDEIMVLLHGLEQAGPALSRSRFIAGVETIRDRRMGIHGNVTFERGRHDGVRTWRQIRWRASCRCWNVDGSLRSLFVS